MKYLYLAVTVLLLSGCSSVIDRSVDADYKHLLGEKTLTADALLCKNEPRKIKGESSFRNEIVWQKIGPECVNGQTLYRLPKGSKVVVRSIEERKYRNLFHFEHWYLLGEVNIGGKAFSFYHYYGFGDFPQQPEWQ